MSRHPLTAAVIAALAMAAVPVIGEREVVEKRDIPGTKPQYIKRPKPTRRTKSTSLSDLLRRARRKA